MTSKRGSILGRILVALSACLLGLVSAGHADTFSDFDAVGFARGESVQNHEADGSTRMPEIRSADDEKQAWFVSVEETDEEIVDLRAIAGQPGLEAEKHGQVWRLAGARGTVWSPHALVGAEARNAPPTHYFATFDFRAATGHAQPGMSYRFAASSGAVRQAELQLRDTGHGLELSYVAATADCGSRTEAVATDLAYETWHTLGIEIDFVVSAVTTPPTSTTSDRVRIYVDGKLALTSTSHAACVGARTVDQLQFEVLEASAGAVGGLFFDNVNVTAGPPPTFIALDEPSTCPSGADAVVRLSIEAAGDDLQALDAGIRFEDDALAVVGVFKTEFSLDDYLHFWNVVEDTMGPDTLDVAVFSGNAQTPDSDEQVLWLVFRSLGTTGSFPLELISGESEINEETPDFLVNGAVNVAAADVRLAIEDSASGGPGNIAYVKLYADPGDDLNAFDFELLFDPLVIEAVGAQTAPATAGFTVTTNLTTPGQAFISLFSATPIPAASGEVVVAEVAFQVVGELGQSTALDVVSGTTDDFVTTCLDDGWFDVCPDEDDDGITVCPGDADDCDDNNATNETPGVGDTLVEDKSPGDVADLSWDDRGVPGPFRLYRGFRDAEDPFSYNHVCLGGPIPGSSTSDADVPLAGRTFYYLISREGACGESELGRDSQGVIIPNNDPCASVFVDTDGDGFAESLDNCPGLFNPSQADGDGDGNGDDCDNCLSVFNPAQGDHNENGDGDECDRDDDSDGVPDVGDNCPLADNLDQLDDDMDGIGNACDPTP